MSAIITLPSSLFARLTALRWRIRLQRAASGCALLAVILSCLAAAAVLVDCWVDLSPQTRQFILLTWLIVAAAGLLRGVIAPLFRRIEAAALAAVIEEKHPDLGERLSSAVELAGSSSGGHGSPILIALLLEEAAARSEQLDFRSAVPARRAAVLIALAAAILLLIASPAWLWPQHYGELAQRFFRPWDADLIEVSADIALTPAAPKITPVELAADSPIITVIPPAYAGSVKQTETLQGLVDLAPLQHSEIRFDFRFTRPAVAAYLEFSRELEPSAPDSRLNGNITRCPLALSEDRQTATLTMLAIKDGKYRLILEAENDTRTELPGGSNHVQLDQPPTVRRFAGKTELRSVLPYERIPFEIEAADDIGVAGIELEYRVNDGETMRQPLELEGRDTSLAVAHHVLDLAGKVQENDRFSYRFRVRDNLPKEYNGPHVIFYPPDHWLTLRIVRQGDTLQQQEILAQRDEINRRLQAIRESLLQEKRDIEQVNQEMRQQAAQLLDSPDSIKQLQRENRASEKALRETAELAEATPELQPVSEQARDVADREMKKSEQALERTPQVSGTEKGRQFQTANEQLNSAIKRLEDLKKTNDRLAQERLNQAKLEMLAQRETQLAEQAAELLGKHPVLDPKARDLAEKLKREQAETTEELQRLTQQSEPLKQSLHQAQQDEARKLAKRARQLAKSQRDLARAEDESKRKRTKDRYADLARKQQELANQQEELGRKTRSSASAAHTEPLKPEKAQRAVEALKQEKATEAIPNQDQAANDLERLAQSFERASNAPADPKQKEAPQRQQFKEQSEQARQMARRQRELREEVQRALEASRSERPTTEHRDQQRRLQEDTGELSRRLQRLTLETHRSLPMQSALQRATVDSQQAQNAMQQARDQGQRGEATAEKQHQERAAQLLDQAARAASEAARSQQAGKPNIGNPKAGEAAAKAGRQMSDAQGQLNRGQSAQAQSSMQQAAHALAKAAQQLAARPAQQPGMPGQQTGLGRQAGGLPDLSAYGLDKATYAGKSWGELPGELRTKIVQDIKARYGADYARMIKSYFEQIADTKKK